MDTYHLSLFAVGLGFLLAVAGSLLILIKAIQTSLIWGLVTFFVPFGNLVYVCVHWESAKIGVLPLVLGWMMIACGAPGIPYMQKLLPKGYHLPAVNNLPFLSMLSRSPAPQNKVADLDSQIQEHRQQLESLQASFARDGAELVKDYQALDAQRKGLKPEDTAAITKFNEAAAAYQARNSARKQMQQQIETTQRDLDALLETRERAAATAAKAKKVVMYTTSHCPACKAAKQYLAQKGVPYDEIDVEKSREGLEAFQKLGGHGVPLILIGDKRMSGFNPQAIDAAL
jgi:glutaredoxin-like YruB-family protein